MTQGLDYVALGQTEEEAALLREHDAHEELHSFEPDDDNQCIECGDTSEGLMHNNTWRNIEPLLVDGNETD